MIIPYGKQSIQQTDIDAVVDVLKSDWLTQGEQVPRFEHKLTALTGSQFAVAVNSATSALHLACIALGLKAGDRLWTSTISYVASANCALYCGASIDFVDIDLQTYNLCPLQLEHKLIQAKQAGTLPKIVIPVHMGGQSCDMKKIYALSKAYGFFVIEDASHSLGGMFENIPIGQCCYSDITVFSFHAVKMITTGEGGAALTNNVTLAKKMKLLRSHGITRDVSEMTHVPDGPWYYQQIALGHNYRMTELQAALGCSQLNRLREFVCKRQTLAKRYNVMLADLPVICPYQNANAVSSFHLYIIRLKLNQVKAPHQLIFDELIKRGIRVNLHYIPIHLQPYYQALGFQLGDFPQAEQYYGEAITLPLFYDMSHEQQDYVVQALKTTLSDAL